MPAAARFKLINFGYKGLLSCECLPSAGQQIPYDDCLVLISVQRRWQRLFERRRCSGFVEFDQSVVDVDNPSEGLRFRSADQRLGVDQQLRHEEQLVAQQHRRITFGSFGGKGDTSFRQRDIFPTDKISFLGWGEGKTGRGLKVT